MSVENARKFAEKVSNHAALAKKISVAESASDVVSLGKKHGFTFALNDLKQLESEWGEPTERAVSPKELEGVAAGKKLSTKRRCRTLGNCLTKRDTCGTPCCIIEPL
jgi:predicted ribosomally synthesized peptide with nif11-like leader